MGMTYMGVRVSKGRRSPSRNLRLLVDTGADVTILPERLLAQLGVKPEFEEEVEIGNGDVVIRPVGRMYVRWRARRHRNERSLVDFHDDLLLRERREPELRAPPPAQACRARSSVP